LIKEDGSIKASFTGAQNQVKIEVDDVGFADVTAKERATTVEGRPIVKGNVLRIKRIGVFGIDQSFNLRGKYVQ
jgi:secreted protein with Ig-like and vWFA domain